MNKGIGMSFFAFISLIALGMVTLVVSMAMWNRVLQNASLVASVLILSYALFGYVTAPILNNERDADLAVLLVFVLVFVAYAVMILLIDKLNVQRATWNVWRRFVNRVEDWWWKFNARLINRELAAEQEITLYNKERRDLPWWRRWLR